MDEERRKDEEVGRVDEDLVGADELEDEEDFDEESDEDDVEE